MFPSSISTSSRRAPPLSVPFIFSPQTVALVAASLAARDAAVFVNDKLVTPAQAAALALARTDTDRFREEDDFDGDVCWRSGGCWWVGGCWWGVVEVSAACSLYLRVCFAPLHPLLLHLDCLVGCSYSLLELPSRSLADYFLLCRALCRVCWWMTTILLPPPTIPPP
jgi:hypothetical protein